MQLLVPVPRMPNTRARPADRPAPGKALKIGLLHNCKPNGDAIIQSVFDALSVRGMAGEAVAQAKPQAGEPITPAMFEQFMQCDLVVTALAN